MIFVGRRVPAGRLQGVIDDPEAIDALIHGESGDADSEIDLDKSWHGLHYLLTGTTWEIADGAGSAILGGAEIGDDNGYGPPRLLQPAEVQAVAAALSPITADALRARWDPAALTEAEVYPQYWDDTDFESYLAPNFTVLRDFYLSAAAANQAVVLVIA
ncbi:YfbM family protein [Actinoplanes sp. NPDC049596]|uniref:YfbM family protein n=1 Tax=unclassified Actinoplanes TaxID=2626549 RepID=UPI003417DB07